MAPAAASESTSTSSTGTIMVGIDGSDHAARAFDEALVIAGERGLDIALTGAFTFPFSYIDPYDVAANRGQQEYRRIVEERIRQATADLVSRAEDAGVGIRLEIAEGDAAGVLTRLSDGMALAVVGKRGRSPFMGRFMGSVSSSFVSHAHCPVLVVPEKWAGHADDQAPQVEGVAPERRIEAQLCDSSRDLPDTGPAGIPGGFDFSGEVVVAVDPGDTSGVVVPQAARWAADHQLPLTLISALDLGPESIAWVPNSYHLVEQPRVRSQAKDRLKEAAEEVRSQYPDLDVRWRFFEGTPAEVIAEATRTADRVVVGNRGRGGFTGLLLGSVSRAVLNRAVSPVLVVPTKKK